MLTKKKMATIAATGMVTVGLLVGGASFALFSSEATSENNQFTAGTLELSTHRHDVPIEGPMFYVNDSNSGEMGTDIWAPLDSHSRAMLIKNTGSLDGKLKTLYAEIESGTNAEKFAEQALVTVAVYETGGVALDATAIDALNRGVDEEFKDLMSGGFFDRLAGKGLQILTAELRKAALNWEFDVNNNGESIRVGLKDVYVGSLKDLLASDGVTANAPHVQLSSGETMHLGYTVTLLDDKGQSFDNNEIKNVTAQFKFKTQFEQVRNN
jgi:spore coat-associated protein N